MCALYARAIVNNHTVYCMLCYCIVRRITQTQGEVLASQVIGALSMIGISVVACSLFYGLLYVLPMQPFVWVAEK